MMMIEVCKMKREERENVYVHSLSPQGAGLAPRCRRASVVVGFAGPARDRGGQPCTGRTEWHRRPLAESSPACARTPSSQPSAGWAAAPTGLPSPTRTSRTPLRSAPYVGLATQCCAQACKARQAGSATPHWPLLQRPGAVGRAAVKDLGTRRQSRVPRGHAEITPSSRGGHAKVTPSPLSQRRSTCRHELRRALQDAPVGALLLAGPLQRRDPISRLYLASVSTVSPLYLPYISPDHSSGATLA